jgi:hypothetical protein
MKSHLAVVAVASAAVLCGFAFTNPPAQDPATARIDKLEKDLAASRLRVEALSTDVADLKKQMASSVQYFQLQAQSASAMAAVLDESEKLGFTYGINPNSRHVMLRGWRDQLAAMQKDVPEIEIPPEKPAPAKVAPKAPGAPAPGAPGAPAKPADAPTEKPPGQ